MSNFMIDAMINASTDKIYQGLFGMTGVQLREYVDLPRKADDELLRDEMGIHALEALADCLMTLGVVRGMCEAIQVNP